jgi:quinol monooxygenase YgiN
MSNVTVIASITVKDGKGDALLAAFEDFWPSLAAESGTEQYILHRSTTNPNLFFVTELYTDQKAFEAHANGPGFAQLGKALGDYVEAFDLQMAEPVRIAGIQP